MALSIPSASVAQRVQRTDPNANSPAGVIYEIPLDTARRDAAPAKRHGSSNASAPGHGAGGGPGGNGAGGSGSAGGPASGSGQGPNGGAGSTAGGGASATAGGSGPSSIHSENGFGSSSQVPGLSPDAPRADGRGGGSSTTTPYLLVLMAMGTAGAIGATIAMRARRR